MHKLKAKNNTKEKNTMNYSEYFDFPFPTILSPQEAKLKQFFTSLPDQEQLKLLNGSKSYEKFCERVKLHREYNTMSVSGS